MADRPEGSEPGPENPFGLSEEAMRQLYASLGMPVPAADQPMDVDALLSRLQAMMAGPAAQAMSTPGGGVNWAFAKDMARKVVAGLGPDPTPSSHERREVSDAVHLAELWLNETTSFAPSSAAPAAWSRAEWVENTMPTWQQVAEPIVSTIATSLGATIGGQLGEAPELAGMQQMFAPMLQQSASSMFGAQLGQALGQLATEVASGTDVGLPLVGQGRVALVHLNLRAYAEGLSVEARDVVLYFALRESARQRLFTSVGWLSSALLALVQHYAREITIEPSALESSFTELQPGSEMSLEELQQLSMDLGKRMFSPARTAEQTEILGRLETLLALVEGWVDDVVQLATARYMPSAGALAESVRRRRAAGGPAEQVFASLVGLELRPRRLRDAANLWAAVRTARGIEGRDAVWHHPDILPTSHDLDDPLGFVAGDRSSLTDDMDEELARLLDSEGGDS